MNREEDNLYGRRGSTYLVSCLDAIHNRRSRHHLISNGSGDLAARKPIAASVCPCAHLCENVSVFPLPVTSLRAIFVPHQDR